MITIPKEIQDALQAVEEAVAVAVISDATAVDTADALINAEAEDVAAQADQLASHQNVTSYVQTLVELINAQLPPHTPGMPDGSQPKPRPAAPVK